MSTYGPTKMYNRLDKICVDRYGASDKDVVMFVIEQNPGLEVYDFLLPPGLSIDLPDRPAGAETTVFVKQIMLWD
jgi:phage tail protein X